MEGLKERKYLHTVKRRFDPIALGVSVSGLMLMLTAVGGFNSIEHFWDARSFFIVVVGTFASLLFQYDFSACVNSLIQVTKSFIGTPEKKLLRLAKELDYAILNRRQLGELREGSEINGELLNDVVYMSKQGLLFDEVDEFVTAKIKDEFFNRQQSVQIMDRAALISPSVGLFGTVIGLVEVLKNLGTPAQIGPSMSLALITTAYGAGMASILFTPLAGRLSHHNAVFLEIHRQILSKIAILMKRDERIDLDHENVDGSVVGL